MSEPHFDSEEAKTDQSKKEAIHLDPPINKKPISNVSRVLLIIIAVFAIGLYFYVHNVTKFFDPTGETYRVKSSDLLIYVSFTDNKNMQIYVTNETGDTVARYDYRYSGYLWNHLFGDLYFSEQSLLSLRTVDKGAKPATVIFGFVSGCSASTWNGEFTVTELSDVLNSGTRYTMYFYSDSLLFDSAVFEKVDDVDEALKYVTDTIIDEYKKGNIG